MISGRLQHALRRMSRCSFLNIFVLIFFNTSALAQATVEVYTGIHYQATLSQGSEDNNLERYWNPSMNGGARLTVQCAESINITSSLTVNHYLFNKSDKAIGASDTERVFIPSAGESSNVLRALIEVQLIDRSEKFIKPYVELGGGYVSENFGMLHGRVEYLKYITYSKDLQFPKRSYFAYTLGGGGMVSLLSSVMADVSIHYYSNTTNRSYYTFGLGIGYEL
jgi:hypothetical protein